MVLTDEAAADLQVCAERPTGFTAQAWADMTPDTRAKLDEVALAAGRNAGRLDRHVNLRAPGTCPPVE